MVRLQTVNSARATPHDRNPVAQTEEYSAGTVAPHSATDRWSLTVSAGKKAFLVGRCSLLRDAAAGAVGYASTAIRHDPAGAEAEVSLARAHLLDNTVGASDADSSVGAFALAGDVLSGETVDLSTTGTIRYESSLDLVEYDA